MRINKYSTHVANRDKHCSIANRSFDESVSYMQIDSQNLKVSGSTSKFLQRTNHNSYVVVLSCLREEE